MVWKQCQVLLKNTVKFSIVLGGLQKKVLLKRDGLSQTPWLGPAQDMYCWTSFQSHREELAKSWLVLERKIRNTITKSNTFEVQNLIPCSLPGLSRQISIRPLIRNLRRAIPLFFLKKKKKKSWTKNEVSHTETISRPVWAQSVSGSQWLPHYLSYLTGKQSKYLLVKDVFWSFHDFLNGYCPECYKNLLD